MGKRNRARTRAIRAEMTTTGANYTRAATAVAGAPAPRAGGTRTDAVKEHVQRLLEAWQRTDDARYDRAEELERSGRRIITGGQTSQTGWDIRDWRTGELIAEGDDGITGYDAAAHRLDPDGTWFHEDHLDNDEPLPDVVTSGVPPSLGQALDDWINSLNTPDEEIAEFLGWPVEKVREYR